MKERKKNLSKPIVIQDRLRARVIRAEHPELETQFKLLDTNNLTFKRHRRVDNELLKEVNSIVEDQGGLRKLTIDAIIQGKPLHGVDEEKLIQVREKISHMMEFTAEGSLSPTQHDALSSLNIAVASEKNKYATQKLNNAREDSEVLAVGIAVALGAVAATGASILSVNNAKNWALLFGGQLDDVANAAAVSVTEFFKKAKKTLKHAHETFIMNNIPTILAFVGAGLVDFAVIPAFLTVGGPILGLLGGAAFFLTATAGSLVAEIGDFGRNIKSIRQLDREGKLPGKQALPDHMGEIEKPNDLQLLRDKRHFQKRLRKSHNEGVSLTDIVKEEVAKINKSKRRVHISDVDGVVAYVSQLEQAQGKDIARDALRMLRHGEVGKIALEETLVNPFRRWLGVGLGISFVSSLFFGMKGLLIGKGITSGVIEGGIGPIETVTAGVGSSLERGVQEAGSRLGLRIRYSKAKLNARKQKKEKKLAA